MMATVHHVTSSSGLRENFRPMDFCWTECTASPKGRHRSLVCSQKRRRKGPDAVRRSLRSRNYETGGICRQEGRSTNTGCQNARTQHPLSSVTDRRRERNKTNKGQHSRENKRKMGMEEDAWTIAT